MAHWIEYPPTGTLGPDEPAEGIGAWLSLYGGHQHLEVLTDQHDRAERLHAAAHEGNPLLAANHDQIVQATINLEFLIFRGLAAVWN